MHAIVSPVPACGRVQRGQKSDQTTHAVEPLAGRQCVVTQVVADYEQYARVNAQNGAAEPLEPERLHHEG